MIDSYLTEQKLLDVVPLEELAQVLNKSLKDNFDYVNVEVVDCPDLTKQPFFLAKPGLNGNPKLVELGGAAYTQFYFNRPETKFFDLKSIAVAVNSDPVFIIGAARGLSQQGGRKCQVVLNLNIEKGVVDQHSRIAMIGQSDEAIQGILPNTETQVAVAGNLFCCEGKPGKVLKIHTKRRTGSHDFVTSIRDSLVKAYPNKVIGLGGTFLLKEGKAKQHVLRTKPAGSPGDLKNWLKYFDMSAPLICVGTLINNDYGLDVELQHFHSFSHHGEAGHYYTDTTPDSVEYLGYFNIGTEIYRIDRPLKALKDFNQN